jgi:glycine/D-amino acid oxidase-like deaminating enzyme
MARASFAAYQAYGRRPGSPVEWCDRYLVSDISHQHAARLPANPVSFARYENRISDLMPASEDLQPGSTEFGTRYIRRLPSLQFNIPDYTHALVTEFLQAGGRFEQREFHAPSDLMALPEKVVINCPGYGARSLWRDTSIVPVRGQITLLPPQPEVKYSVIYRDVLMLSRRDGIVVQSLRGGDMRGYGVDTETPDRREAEAAFGVIAGLY